MDRLSELHDSIIFEIFWLLPMKEVVRTTILSKRWDNLWKTSPYLNFDSYHSFEFIIRALVFWKGLKILKFKFTRHPIHELSYSDLSLGMCLAKYSRVEEVYLENLYIYNNEHGYDKYYSAPRCLFSCSWLKVLSLKICNLQTYGNVQLNLLRSLTIENCNHDEHFIDQVVSGSPQLEVFILNFKYSRNNLSIRSTSLKELSIVRIYDHGKFNDSELRIWSPNLVTLHLGGVPYDDYSLMNLSSLAHLTLDFTYQTREDDAFGGLSGQIFPTIQRVEKLELTDLCIKVLLGYMKDTYSISTSSNLKSLKINKIYEGDYEQIVDILQIFPKLETLVLQDKRNSYMKKHATSYERNLPESFLLQLRTVDISLCKVEYSIFPFVEILLKHASNLQKMVFRVRGMKPPSMPVYLEQKLRRMPRSSPTAELFFAEY